MSSFTSSTHNYLEKYIGYFDGGLRNNEMVYGWIILDRFGNTVAKDSGFISGNKKTVNLAEYGALIKLMESAQKLELYHITIHGDSQSVCRQINGEYTTKAKHLLEKLEKVIELSKYFVSLKIKWIPREMNLADRETRF